MSEFRDVYSRITNKISIASIGPKIAKITNRFMPEPCP